MFAESVETVHAPSLQVSPNRKKCIFAKRKKKYISQNTQYNTVMKKQIIIFLIFSVFSYVSAQSYTESFNEMFQNVELSHTSTGILNEIEFPYEFIAQHSSLVKQTLSNDANIDDSINNHSIGINVG